MALKRQYDGLIMRESVTAMTISFKIERQSQNQLKGVEQRVRLRFKTYRQSSIFICLGRSERICQKDNGFLKRYP